MLSESTKPLSELNKREHRLHNRLKKLNIILIGSILILIVYILINAVLDSSFLQSGLSEQDYLNQIEKKTIEQTAIDEVKFNTSTWAFASRTGKMPIANTAQEKQQFNAITYAEYPSLLNCENRICSYSSVIEMHQANNWFETGDTPGINNCNVVLSNSRKVVVKNNLERFLILCGPSTDEIAAILFTSLNYSEGHVFSQRDKDDIILTTLFSAHFTDNGGSPISIDFNSIQDTYGFIAAEKTLLGVTYD